jgi:methionine-gamma-lyase
VTREFGFATRAVHVGQGIDKDSRAVRRPITLANSFAFPEDPEALASLGWSSVGINIYTRNGGVNQKYLEEKLASLHGAEDCVVLASGVAALHGLFFSLLRSGDHVVVADTTYIAVYRLLNELFPERFNITSTLVDASDPENVRAAMRPNTKLVHIEPIANPTVKITDVRAVAEIAHAGGALLSVDNTFSSPANQRPLEQGADFVVESLTKYINGHGDSLGGAVLGSAQLLSDIRLNSQVNVGGVISPFAAWLIMRGAATLPLRMERVNATALTVARWLEGFSGTRFVWYPGLESTPGHAVAAGEMSGFGGVIAFDFDISQEAHLEILQHFKVIVPAVSLGHDESLIAPMPPDDERMPLYPVPHQKGFFRFAIGLEDADDIIWDLEQAYRAVV